MKKILITGAGSYIGMSFERWVNRPEFAGMYEVDTMDMQGAEWKEKNFFGYDTVFHVAGIAHADVGKVTEKQKAAYYKVNCDLAIETAQKAKKCGVKQFIYMSSIIVYGEGTSVKKERVITQATKPSPTNFYGDSKWKAEQKLMPLSDEQFHVAILRPPMIYGEGCKGNYQVLKKIALKLPIFPDFPNERSMLYIKNLCEFMRILIESGSGGLHFPQNADYVKTAEMIYQIAVAHGKKLHLIKGLNWAVFCASHCPGKIGKMVNKAFGNLKYQYEENGPLDDFQLYLLEDSIGEAERD